MCKSFVIKELKNVSVPKVSDTRVTLELPTSLFDAIQTHGKGIKKTCISNQVEV
jgi:hypothetical protein